MNDKESVKLGLLAVIAVTLIANTYVQFTNSSSQPPKPQTVAQSNDFNPQTPDLNMQQPEMPPQPETPKVPDGPRTSVSFAKASHSFGTIKQNTENPHKFKFTNTGSSPLIIVDAKGSCGCTVPEYPKEPIPPGGTGEIEVVYSPGTQEGSQTKTVTITANTEPEQTFLTISAEVIP